MRKADKMDQELHEAMVHQRDRFIEKFGREPTSEDPIFFDPDCDMPTPLSEAKVKRGLIEAARKAGLDVDRILGAFGFEDKDGVAKSF
jgi:hypothetical protein